MSSQVDCDASIAYMDVQGILSVFHYVPLRLSEMGRRFGGEEGGRPVTEGVSDRLIRLPPCDSLTEAEQTRVVVAIGDFR